ncbi:MAG TPA: CPBP family glutamic-type intramembrane protease [Nitrososphaerales archaeon]|nr:CPBP family glutamic-type intramembrane protease [Nitrososphaerales archaeon]
MRFSNQLLGFVIIFLTMIEMFTIPKGYFVLGSIVATSCMILITPLLTRYFSLFAPTVKTVTVGIFAAVILYLIFLGGNNLVGTYTPFGIGAQNEDNIYSLFSSTPMTLKIIVFGLDAVGFESYFRGNLQNLISSKFGFASVFIVALIDAAIHLATFNPLFSITTFIADSVWGLEFHITKDIYSAMASHFFWDMLVFVILPIT